MLRATLFVLSLPLLATACSELPLACDAAAYASVQVEVVDESGAPIDDAVVEFSVDGDDVLTACEAMEQGEYVCGWEVEGDLEITLSKEGFESEVLEVTVASDACHVITEQRSVTLEAEVQAGG